MESRDVRLFIEDDRIFCFPLLRSPSLLMNKSICIAKYISINFIIILSRVSRPHYVPFHIILGFCCAKVSVILNLLHEVWISVQYWLSYSCTADPVLPTWKTISIWSKISVAIIYVLGCHCGESFYHKKCTNKISEQNLAQVLLFVHLFAVCFPLDFHRDAFHLPRGYIVSVF